MCRLMHYLFILSNEKLTLSNSLKVSKFTNHCIIVTMLDKLFQWCIKHVKTLEVIQIEDKFKVTEHEHFKVVISLKASKLFWSSVKKWGNSGKIMEDMQNMSLRNQSICNTSSCSNNTDKEIYNSLGSAVPIFLTVYTIILMFAVAGNALVCCIVASNRRMHDVTNYLLVNLSVSDLIQALATVFQITDFVVKDLNLGMFWYSLNFI